MDIVTKTRTTNVHTAVVSQDELKSVALLAVKGRAGIIDDTKIVSSKVDVDADGSLTVEIIEAVTESSAPIPSVPVEVAASAPEAPVILIPSILAA